MDNLLKRNLEGPPFCRLAVSDYIGCAKLIKASTEAIAVLKTCMNDNSSLWTEIDILEKSVYKIKLKWRLEPLYKGTKQVLKCMKILKSEKIFSAISTAIESVLGLDGKTLVPSKQYLQYLLVKIIGVSKLAVQTIAYCEYVHGKLLSKIRIGHVLPSVMSFTAFISRIWVLSHTLLVQLQSCYDSLYSLHLLASDADYKWLLDDVLLPVSFPIDVHGIIAKSSGSCMTSERLVSTEIPDRNSESRVDTALPANAEDFGVLISRDSFTRLVEQTADDVLVKGKRKITSKDGESEVQLKKSKNEAKPKRKHKTTGNTQEKVSGSNNTEVVLTKTAKKRKRSRTNAVGGGESTSPVTETPVSSAAVKTGKRKSKKSAKKLEVKNVDVQHDAGGRRKKREERKKLLCRRKIEDDSLSVMRW